MARPNTGEHPPSGPLASYQTPAGGMVHPPAGPYGPGLNHAYPTHPAAKAGPTPAGLLNALRRRWVLAVFIGGLVAVAAAAGAWAVLPSGKHTAKATIQLRPAGTDVTTRQPGDDLNSFRQSQIYLLKTRDLINRVLAVPAVSSLDTVKNADDPARLLEDGIKVDASVAPDILTVSLSGDNLQDLQTIMTELVKRYVDDATAYERRSSDDRVRQLEEKGKKFQAEIEAKEKTIELLVGNNGTAGGKDAEALNAARHAELEKLNHEVFTTTKEVHDLEVHVKVVQKKLDAVKADAKRIELDPLRVNQQVMQDLRVSGLIGQRVEKELRLTRERAVAGAVKGSTIVTLEDDIARLDKDIAAIRAVIEPEIRLEMEKVYEQQLKNTIADFQDKLNGTREMLGFRQQYRDTFRATLKSGSVNGFTTSNLVQDLIPLREYRNKVEAQRLQLTIDKGTEARVSVREAPFVMTNQNVKQRTLISTAAGMGSFFGVIALIGLLEWRTRRVDGVDQVVTDLGMRVIGTVPAFPNKASLKAAEAAGNANWRFILNESINSTRTMLLHAARSQSMQVVMVTSATQGEGKTSLTSQLAGSMATAGMRTLIVDCDLRNPSIHKLFELNLSIGVSEVLCQEADVSDAVQPTTVPNLWIIPAGQCSNRVIAALAQGHPLETLFNRLRGQFDFIIVDSCPVLPVADALLIGQHVDGVVFSIMQDISQLPKIVVASEKLHALNVPLLGAVVNGVRTGSAYYAYGYNYVKQLPA